MSTNVLSKAGYDLVARFPGSARRQRWAATAGYVGTELAKEAPSARTPAPCSTSTAWPG